MFFALGGVGSGLKIHAHAPAWNLVLSGSKRWVLLDADYKSLIRTAVEDAKRAGAARGSKGLEWTNDQEFVLKQLTLGFNFIESVRGQLLKSRLGSQKNLRRLRKFIKAAESQLQSSLGSQRTIIYEFVQKQEELLYIPGGMLHGVLNLDNFTLALAGQEGRGHRKWDGTGINTAAAATP